MQGIEISNLDNDPLLDVTTSVINSGEILAPRNIKLTPRSGIHVERVLPHKNIRSIGAWIFLDHFLPQDDDEIMSVAAHPHTGLQTVTWLFSGEVHHHDSLGSDQWIYPGELNLMTAGKGISHSEISRKASGPLHGVQLWVVLSRDFRKIEPRFGHYNDLAQIFEKDFIARVMIGEIFGAKSNAEIFSPLVAVELTLLTDEAADLELNAEFEYGFMAINSKIEVANQLLDVGELYYQPSGANSIKISGSVNSKVLMIGGEPFTEDIVMWWNFVGRSHEEIEEMRSLWETKSEIFGVVHDELNERIPAPIMPNIKLKPRSNKKLG